MQVYLGDIIPTSTLDWPGKVVLAAFFRGCPFRCPYCSNARFVEAESGEPADVEKVTGEIGRAREFIDGVVLSGGEPLMQFAAFKSIASYAKSSGLLVGVETNGMYPGRLKTASEDGLLDAVMLDVKAPLTLEAYSKAIGDVEDCKNALNAVTASVDLCNRLRADGKLLYYEARTTVFRGLTCRPEDIAAIASRVSGDVYVLQQGRPEIAMDETVRKLEAMSRNELLELAKQVKTTSTGAVKVRTREMGDETVTLSSS